jgi:hypothetical protein
MPVLQIQTKIQHSTGSLVQDSCFFSFNSTDQSIQEAKLLVQAAQAAKDPAWVAEEE